MEIHVQEQIENGVATLTLNRPDFMNALSGPMIELLIEALGRLEKDPQVGAIVLTGAGRGFCAGGDVKGMASGSGGGSLQHKVENVRHMHRVPLALAQCQKIIIAMINGPAMGAGLGIALACDLRISARSARFGASFVNIALATDFGVSWSLPRVVGAPKAREMILTGDIIDAAAALQAGLVTRVVDDAELAAETQRWAQRFASGPAIAYRYLKRNLVASEDMSFSEMLEIEALHQAAALDSEDHREAAKAFVEKRRAVFKGC